VTPGVARELHALLHDLGPSTLAVAESLTGGRLQALITSVSGASTFFAGGMTVYNLQQKHQQLGVDEVHARAVNCVSQQVAVELAVGVLERFGTQFALATTGYAEIDPAQGVAVPYAWWALAHQRCSRGELIVRAGQVMVPNANRTEVQQTVAVHALAALLTYLHDYSAPEPYDGVTDAVVPLPGA
jgi:nicotinamide-nucleotide amidase